MTSKTFTLSHDFFGQFQLKKRFVRLSRQDVQRMIDRLFILCPVCYTEKLFLPTPDDYVICSRCNIHWDLLPHRVTTPAPSSRVTSKLRVNGSVYRRHIPIHGQLTLNGGVE